MKYIHVLMMCLALTLTTSVQAQKQKKEKEPKKEKVQKEKKQKDSKQKESKKKDQFVSFAEVKVAKKGTVEYNAQRQAAVLVMDSMLLHTRTSVESRNYFGRVFQQDDLEKFADMICAKFGNDPVLMDSVAGAFFGLYSNAFLGEKRFAELKQMHPTFVDVYYTEASYNHTLAWKDYAALKQIDSTRLVRSKALIDSAKLLVPQSPDPYMRWIRMQGKYDPESVFPEIDTLKMRVANYPAYLKVAREFYLEADNDPEFRVSARKCYAKAERDSMKLYDYQFYTDLCYRIGSKSLRKEDFLEGIDVANEGLAKYPNEVYLLRRKLYSSCALPQNPVIRVNGERIEQYTEEGIKERWDSAYSVALQFMELPDSIKNATDYGNMADAYMNTKHYSVAVKLLKSQLEAGIKDTVNHALALRNLVDCYNNLELYDDAITAYDKFQDFKRDNGMEMNIGDYQKLFFAYYYQGGDTLNMPQDRITYFQKADSVLAIMGSVSQENIGYVNTTRLDVATQLAALSGSDYSYPLVLVAANRLVKSMKEIPESEREASHWYYMMKGMRYAMEHYIFADKNGEAWICADAILGMPLSMELDGLSSGRTKEYDQHVGRAEKLLGMNVYSAPGKKLRKQGWRPF